MTYYERLIQGLCEVRNDDYSEEAYENMRSTYLAKHNLYGTKNNVVEIIEDYYIDYWKSRYFEKIKVIVIDVDTLNEDFNISVKFKMENNSIANSDLIIKWVSKRATNHLLATTWVNLDCFIKENNLSINTAQCDNNENYSYTLDHKTILKIYNATVDESTSGNKPLLRSEIVQYLKCINTELDHLASINFLHRAQKLRTNLNNKSWHSLVGKNILSDSEAFTTLINLIDAKIIFKFTTNDSNKIDQEINTNVNLKFHEIANEYFENSDFFKNIIMKTWFIIVISKQTNKICNIYVCSYDAKESLDKGFSVWLDTKNKIKKYKKGLIKKIAFIQASNDRIFHVRPHATKEAKKYTDTDISIKSWWINKSEVVKNNLINIAFDNKE